MDIHNVLLVTFPTRKADFLLRMQQIKNSCTGNPDFTGAEAANKLALFDTALTAYEAALLLGRGHDNAQEQARKALVIAAQNLANALETEAQGDRAKLETTGFDLAKEGRVKSVGAPGTAENVEVRNGDTLGEIIARCKKAPNTKWCDVRTTLTPDDPASWKEHTGFTDARRMTVGGFAKKDEVFAQIRCCNGHGKSDWSQTVSVIIGAH